MSPFLLSLVGSVIIALVLIILIFLLRKFRDEISKRLDYFTALTVGILLSIIFLEFLPEIISAGLAPNIIGISILSGLLLFYLLELFLHFHHCKDLDNIDISHHKHTRGELMFAGTLVHNILHGVILFTAFSVSTEFGIGITIAIVLHSIPQNIANYIMNHNNEKLVRLAAIGGVGGVILLLPLRLLFQQIYPQGITVNLEIITLAVISGGLLYIALSDILPEFKDKGNMRHKILYLLFVMIGISIMFIL